MVYGMTIGCTMITMMTMTTPMLMLMVVTTRLMVTREDDPKVFLRIPRRRCGRYHHIRR
jgi:hypothetical protein